MKEASLTKVFIALLKRDLLLAYRHRAEIFNPMLFFILVITLFPLGTGADTKLLQTMAPGISWVAALLAAMLSLDTIFRRSEERRVGKECIARRSLL